MCRNYNEKLNKETFLYLQLRKAFGEFKTFFCLNSDVSPIAVKFAFQVTLMIMALIAVWPKVAQIMVFDSLGEEIIMSSNLSTVISLILFLNTFFCISPFRLV